MIDFRDRHIEPSTHRHNARRCLECNGPTTHKKPYCSDHVHHNDHAAEVLGELVAREQEVLDVFRYGDAFVRHDGSLADDVRRIRQERGSIWPVRLRLEVTEFATADQAEIYLRAFLGPPMRVSSRGTPHWPLSRSPNPG